MLKKILTGILILGVACTGHQEEEKVRVNELPAYGDKVLTLYINMVHALQSDDYLACRTMGEQLAVQPANDGVTLALVRMGNLVEKAASLYDQRAILEQFGLVMPMYIEQHITNDFYIYTFKCVNSFDNKEVVWLDVQKETTNPFIGKKSTDCIELINTIKPVLKSE